jgi:hypothetical protein
VPLSASFVRASGSQFILDSQPFRVAGANNFYVGFESDSMVEPVFDLGVQTGLNALKTGHVSTAVSRPREPYLRTPKTASSSSI